jgi:transposase
MDNASIHNERDLINILAPKNITLVKLPPYSYDFNPIELVFGSVTVYVRRWPELLRANMSFAIVNAFLQVPIRSVQKFYRKCWQVMS